MERENYEAYLAQKDLTSQASEDDLMKYAPQMQEHVANSQAVVIEQVNPRKVVRDIILEIAGQEYDDREKKIIIVGNPLMNEFGLQNAKIKLRGIINQNTIMSSLDPKEITRLMVQWADDLTNDLGIHWREYGIKNLASCDMIVNILIMNSFLALKRAQMGYTGNEKNWYGRIAFEKIGQNQQQPTSKKESILDKFKL